MAMIRTRSVVQIRQHQCHLYWTPSIHQTNARRINSYAMIIDAFPNRMCAMVFPIAQVAKMNSTAQEIHVDVIDSGVVWMEFAWTAANIVTEFVTVSMEVMKRIVDHHHQSMSQSIISISI